jgi:hypothetical protein
MTLPNVSGDWRIAQPMNARNPSQRQTTVVAEPSRTRLAKTRLRVIPKLSP